MSRLSKFAIVAFALAIIPACSWFSTYEKSGTADVVVDSREDVKASTEEGKVIKITSKADFENYLQTKPNVVADFFAEWCPPCKRMHPINGELAKEYTDVCFLEVDIDVVKDLTSLPEYTISGVPTFIFFKNGVEVERNVGAMSKEAYRGKIKSHFGL